MNQTLEDNTIEGEKKLIKNRGFDNNLSRITQELVGCKLDGSAIVFDEDEVVDEDLIVGQPENPNNDQPVQQPIMVDFEQENGVDDAGALKDAIAQLRTLEFDEQDLEFSFNQIETKMQTNGVKKQWSKLQALTTVIPKKYIDELKRLLRKKESEFPENDAYLRVKKEIFRIFGPSDEIHFQRAMSRVLSGKPSQLARALVNDLCDHELEGCCCHRFIVGLWKRQLPSSVKQAISAEPFTKANFDNITKIADQNYESTRPQQIAAIKKGSNADTFVTPVEQSKHDTAFNWDDGSEMAEVAQSAATAAIAAYTRGRGGFRGGRGRGRGGRNGQRGGGRGGGQNSNQGGENQKNQHPKHKTPRHADLPPFEACFRHWTHGKSAHFCMEPGTCPWKQYWIPRSNTQ